LRFSDVSLAFIVLSIIILIIVPLKPLLLDVLLVINILVSIFILLKTLYTKEPLQFSVFPSLLLIVTLYRLALNISSTRLILSNNGNAGDVIKTFGNFVIGDNLVVGLIIFLIIILIQFIVITKGAERIAEVAARFTLDAMPGKQMAIDADLNAGLIEETEAKERRKKVQREADFYGAMDGASKFVKGDAIVGIIITVINIVGGILIGCLGKNPMPLDKVVSVYTLATVGDGLVTQLPALLVSTASGIIVTRVGSSNNLGEDFSRQILSQPAILIIGGVILLFISLIPGLPKIPIFVLAALTIVLGYTLFKSYNRAKIMSEEKNMEQMAKESRKPESIMSLLNIEPIEIEFGYSIIPLADAKKGGDLLDRVYMNIQLRPSEYVVKIKGIEVARGEVMISHYLAMNTSNSTEEVEGIETREAAFGLPALWIAEKEKERAELLGYTVVDPPTVIATHLTEVIKKHSHELMGRQHVQMLLDNVRKTNPVLVDEVVPKVIPLGKLQKVLINLLKENISIRDMITIIETLGDYGAITDDTDLLTEYVRQSLKRVITKKFVPDNNKLRVITIDPALEQLILSSIQQTEHGSYLNIEPQTVQKIIGNMKKAADKIVSLGIAPIVLTAPVVRQHLKKITEQVIPDLIVLSFSELEHGVEIQSDSVVTA
jgi:flagellar biosynthesis protein FlhA